jgi:hypothetical protein
MAGMLPKTVTLRFLLCLHTPTFYPSGRHVDGPPGVLLTRRLSCVAVSRQ